MARAEAKKMRIGSAIGRPFIGYGSNNQTRLRLKKAQGMEREKIKVTGDNRDRIIRFTRGRREVNY
jgi:hypothetical protein